MTKVTAFVGSARKAHTYGAVRRFCEYLEASGDIETEIVMLSDYVLDPCLGCKLCFENGEQACPLRDDRDLLIDKLAASDGVVFASPSYMFQVSGLMKTWIDRLAFIAHRPRFFGKAFTTIIVQGVPMDAKIGRYLSLVGACFGFSPVAGTRHTAREPMTDRESRKLKQILAVQANRFRKALARTHPRTPSLKMLIGFRIARTTMKLELDDRSCDYRYFREHGWFESAYYYPVRLGLLKHLVGWLFDKVGTRMAQPRET